MIETDEDLEEFRLVKSFIETARMLYLEDNISNLKDNEITKFLISRDMHQGRALEALAETLAWRKLYVTDSILTEDFTEHEKRGKITYFGQAMDTSTALVLISDRWEELPTQKTIEQSARFIIYMIEKGRRDGSIKDKVTVIMDIQGRGFGKQEAKLASIVVPILQKHYPETLSRLYLFPTNALFYMTYQMSSYLLAKDTIPKIRLVESPASLAEYFNRDQYYNQFGGLAVDPFVELLQTSQADLVSTDNKQGNDPTKKDGKQMQKIAIFKSAPLNLIEEIFVAPLEFHQL